jgi:carboxymethylenebutenolidase
MNHDAAGRNDVQSQFDSLMPAAQLDRRGFIVTALGAGFALAVQPSAAQSPIKTPADGLTVGEVKVPVADGEIVAYRAMPQGKSGLPVVLVVSEIFGVHEYIADVCRRLAKEGYLAIAPELFARYGDPRKMANVQDILAGVIAKTPDAGAMADLDACVAWAAKNGGDSARLGVTGFCWGGRITWTYCVHNPSVKAGVAWYGRLVAASMAPLQPVYPVELAPLLKVPVLGLYGEADVGIPVETVEKMRAALKAAGNTTSEIVLYPEAPHAFYADYRPSYRKGAADDGWQKMRDWFTRHGV